MRSCNKLAAAAAVLLAFVAGHGGAQTGTASAGGGQPSQASAVTDIILARQMLMIDMQRLMEPVDGLTAGESSELSQLQSAASSLAAMMNATAHLFPESSNRYDAAADFPETSALPALWENFATFTALARSSAEAAVQLSLADETNVLQRAKQMRASCDACHALFLLPYEPPSISEEDLDFDFDALFDSFEDSDK